MFFYISFPLTNRYENLGFGNISCCPATECIVLMAVGMNDNWKLPIGYFPVAKMSAETQMRLITEALVLLWDIGVTVVSLTGKFATTSL